VQFAEMCTARPVPAVAAGITSSCSGASIRRKRENCLHDARSVIRPVKSTKILDASCGCSNGHSRRGSSMRILIAPIHYVQKKRARRRQVRTVLEMLSISGVVRLGHVEPRYFEPPAHVDALNRQDARGLLLALPSPPSQPSLPGRTVPIDWGRLRHWAGHATIRIASRTWRQATAFDSSPAENPTSTLVPL
jgi:hypothetical protein